MDNRAINFNREKGKANTTKTFADTTQARGKHNRLAELQNQCNQFDNIVDFRSLRKSGALSK